MPRRSTGQSARESLLSTRGAGSIRATIQQHRPPTRKVLMERSSVMGLVYAYGRVFLRSLVAAILLGTFVATPAQAGLPAGYTIEPLVPPGEAHSVSVRGLY